MFPRQHALTSARVFPGGHMGQTPQTLLTIIAWRKNELC